MRSNISNRSTNLHFFINCTFVVTLPVFLVSEQFLTPLYTSLKVSVSIHKLITSALGFILRTILQYKMTK